MANVETLFVPGTVSKPEITALFTRVVEGFQAIDGARAQDINALFVNAQAFADTLKKHRVKVVNGIRVDDVIITKDKSVTGRVVGFEANDTVTLFKRDNGTIGRAATDFVRKL